MQTQFGGLLHLTLSHPNVYTLPDALGLAEGGVEQDPQEWRRLFQNAVSLAVVGRRAIQHIVQLLQEPIQVDSHEEETDEDVPTKVIAQILHRVLAGAPPQTEDAITIPDEHFELLQDLLERPRPPLKRKLHAPPTTPRGEMSVQGEHVICFMRPQADFDALRVASGVIFTVAGVIKESPQYHDESLLLGRSRRKSTTLGADLVGQNSEKKKDRKTPYQARVGTSRRTRRSNGKGTCGRRRRKPTKQLWSSPSSEDSHRRRRMLAQHHKDHIGENRTEEDEDHSLMAMSRSTTEASELGGRTQGEEEEVEPLDDDPLSGRFLPALRGSRAFPNLVQLERRRGQTSRALLSYLEWLRGEPQWRALQGPLIEELQAAHR